MCSHRSTEENDAFDENHTHHTNETNDREENKAEKESKYGKSGNWTRTHTEARKDFQHIEPTDENEER